MYISANIGGKIESRPYTPITSDDELGYFELVIKVCRESANYTINNYIPIEKGLLLAAELAVGLGGQSNKC